MAKSNVKQMTPTSGKEATPAVTRALSPFEEMDRLFDQFFGRGLMRPLRWEQSLMDRVPGMQVRVPEVDVIDREKDILVRASVPGIDKKDLDISVSDNTVTIKGETSSETTEEEGDYYRSEISRGAFARTVALPGDVDADKASAQFKDGILELTLPKVKQARRRKIEVR